MLRLLRIFIPLRVAERAMRRQGADAWEIDHALRMASYFAAGSDGATTDAVERLTGHAPRAYIGDSTRPDTVHTRSLAVAARISGSG